MSVAGQQDVAAKLAELRMPLADDINYNLTSMFPRLDGWGAKGEIKRRAKLILPIEDKLRELLKPGEQVLYIAKGVQFKFLEQYFMGALWAAAINQTMFIFTNARLVLLRTNSSGKPKETFWMIYYSQIERLKASWHGTVEVRLRDGAKFKFSGFSKQQRKELPQVLEQAVAEAEAVGFDPEVSQSRENLCSYCLDIVAKDEYTCQTCGATFWMPTAVALRSLAFPSWGDFVMKHYLIASVELLGYGLMWLVILAAISTDGLTASLPFVLFLLAISHVPDAILTYFVGRKGLHPRTGPVRQMAGEAVAAKLA